MKKYIFALGFFDGVHLGHQALLRECTCLAARTEAKTASITFDDHPQAAFTSEYPPLLTAAQERVRLLRQFGMEKVVSFPTTKEVMSTKWRDFLENLMTDGAVGFVCGDDFHFGHRGLGNAAKLQEFCKERSLPCIIVPEQRLDGIRISSTHIRRLLEQGDMETAAKFLGHPHLLSGCVVHGRQIGRTLGIPTANLTLPEGCVIPAFGVYACKAAVEGRQYLAVTNIGTRPTVGGHRITVEPWLLDFDGDLYGREITLEFYKFLRPEQKFADLQALQRQIQLDAAQVRSLFR